MERVYSRGKGLVTAMVKGIAVVVFALFAASCWSDDASTNNYTYDDSFLELEKELLDSLMNYRYASNPELLASWQDEGYYYQIVPGDDQTTLATNVDTCWVRYYITSRNLTGNDYNVVNYTTNRIIAEQQGTFSLYTCYEPALAQLQLEEDDDYNNALDYLMRAEPVRAGDQISLFSLSNLCYYLVNGPGGNDGGATISSGTSFWSEIEMVEVIEDIEEWEANQVSTFISMQSNPSDWIKMTSEDEDDEEGTEVEVYMNSNLDMYAKDLNIEFIDPYPYKFNNFNSFDEVEELVVDSLQRFTVELIDLLVDYGADVDENGVLKEGEVVGQDDALYIWYVGRLMNGFIFDTNIDGIEGMMFENYATQSQITYLPSSTTSVSSYIEGWFHTIPKMKYGSWNVIVVTSPYAYESDGVTGSSTSTTIHPYEPLIFYIYVEPDTY